MRAVRRAAARTRPRPLFLLVGAILLLDALFLAALTPLLPRYVEELELSKTGAGILTGAFAVGGLLGSFPGAWLATRAGTRRALVFGLALNCVAGLAFALGETIVVLDASRMLLGIGSACSFSGAMGWLVSATPPQTRGATIGRVMSAVVVGLLLGPVVGALAHETGSALPFASVALLLGALALVTHRFPDPPRPPAAGAPSLRALRDARIRLGAWLVTMESLAFGAILLLIPLRLDAIGAGGVAIGATFFLAAAVEAVAQPLVGRASDRRGRMAPIRLGLAGMLVSLALLPLPQTAWLLACVVVVVWVLSGILNTPAMTLLTDGVDGHGLDHGLGFALLYFLSAGGQGVGAIAGGALATRASDAVVYLALAALCALTLAALARRRPLTARA